MSGNHLHRASTEEAIMPVNEYATVDSFYSLAKWLSVLNANAKNSPNPGYKAERITFDGGATEITQKANGLMIQRGEGGLATSDKIDFSQGMITGSNQATHLAIRGEGFFVLASPSQINAQGGYAPTVGSDAKLLLTRDGEFKPDKNGLLQHVRTGYYLVTNDFNGAAWTANGIRAVYDNSSFANRWDNASVPPVTPPLPGGNPALTQAAPLSYFVDQSFPVASSYAANGTSFLNANTSAILKIPGAKDKLKVMDMGTPNTVFDFGHIPGVRFKDPAIPMLAATLTDASIAWNALEMTNAPMTSIAPELTQAQRMYDNLTKVLSARKSNFQLLNGLFK
jgi:flagellar basal body rod protein FlgG